jgi:5-formyltetrahydrofolate cyclo-ligase
MRASIVKVNPDSPQRKIREIALELGKSVVMPSPRLSRGFIILEPSKIKISYAAASTIRMAFTCGRLLSLHELPRIDMIICGSVAVSAHDGARLGKGEGYSEIEFAALAELGLVQESTPIATSVHSIQLVDTLPVEPFDLHVDLIATEKELIRVSSRFPRPQGIDWKLLGSRLEEMPILKELRSVSGPKS